MNFGEHIQTIALITIQRRVGYSYLKMDDRLCSCQELQPKRYNITEVATYTQFTVKTTIT
jgi:hypothetical protein